MPTGINRFDMKLPQGFAGRCPILSVRMKEKGRLDMGEINCHNMSAACNFVFDQWARSHQP
jgi:hypothetical protein